MKVSSMDLALWVSRWLGIAPYVCTPEYQVSRTIDICGRIVFTFISFIGLILTIQQTFFQEDHIQLTLNFILCCIRILGAITVLIGIYSASDRLRRMFQLLKRLDQIDVNLPSHHQRSSRKVFIILLIHIVSALVLRITTIALMIYENGLNVIVFARIVRFSTFVIWDFLEIQFMALSGRILETLEGVNQCLEDLRHGEHSVTSTEEMRTANTIRQLARHYLNISEIVRCVTNSDGVMLMLLLVTHAMFIEISWHKAVIWLSDTSNTSTAPITFILLLTLQSTVKAVTLITFIDFFHRTHKQMERTHQIVNYLKYQRSDEEKVSDELEIFNRILLLNKTTYSPLSMFTLSRSLVAKIFGSIVTYLFIILNYSKQTKLDMNSFL